MMETTAGKTLPVVLRIPHLGRPTVTSRRPTLGRLHPMRLRLRMDVLLLLSAMPLLSLATYIGWKMATASSNEAPVAVADHREDDRVRIEAVDSPHQLPDLSEAPEIPASHSVPVDPEFIPPLPPETAPRGITIPDPKIQPSSATIPTIGEIHLRHADFRRRCAPSVGVESNSPCVRIQSVTSVPEPMPPKDDATQGY